ncbi:unnamed protein product [Parascedosporium putredinis]|uniref:Importin-95 n=1 Tax=Parascedosporium putredinis TaxID=1442378 RepID=A0A9P1GVR3_9PEZI|nr:unnamed protein product [Parascedosporium putredinis]CAI7988247.1 unnamed protein product [Parascedosporium putredinis]
MSNTEINQVLANSLSPDATLRNDAEQQLSQAAENNFPLYLATLVQELANESAQGPIRAAAGIALKNAFTARDFARHQELQSKWLQQTDDDTKARVKELTLQTLSSSNAQAGTAAAQVIAAVAAIELPRGQWSDLMTILVKNVSEGAPHQKQASLTTIGYVCESQDPELRASLISHSNAILTAVVQGARKEEENLEVRLAAITALGDSLEFVGNNFRNEGERNYIMQVVCEATQASDPRIQQGAFGCLNRIMGLYYDNMRFYMERALFGLTILGMKSDDEDVAKLAVEFWSTVCEEEISIEDDNATVENSDQIRPFYNFARVAANEVVPVLLSLLTKQDEDATDDEYNLSRAAYQCLSLYAQAVGSSILTPVLQFVEGNLRNDDWHNRDAAVSAFGAVMEGPEEKVLDPIIKRALLPLIAMMDDSSLHVKDSTAYTLGRITEACPSAIDAATHLQPLIQSLFNGLTNHPKMAASCCWALMNLAERFAGEPGAQSNSLTPHFNDSVTHLLTLSARNDCDSATRTAVYEVLNVFVQNAANESLQAVASLSDVILKRLEETVPMQSQVVSVEDKITLSDMQTSLSTVLQAIILRLDKEIAPQGDRIMQVLLQILSTVGGKSSVPEAVFAGISALATAVGEDFVKYMEAFSPFLYSALGNQDEPGLCSMAIGLVSDITRSLAERSQPYCDNFMNYLLNNLRSTTLSNQFKPAILQCFGDIAVAIEGHFETYLPVVAQVLQQASSVTASPRVLTRSGALEQFVPSIFTLLQLIADDLNRSEALMRSAMGVIGDLADAYPNGELVEAFRQEWLTTMIKQTKSNRDFQPRTIETARWARELVKRQVGGQAGTMQQA